MKLAPVGLGLLVVACLVRDGQPAVPTPRSARDGLKPFHELVGSWRAIGMPEGSKAQKQKGAWQEKLRWEWQFKGDDCWLHVAFDQGKHFADGRLRYLADKDQYQLTLKTIGGDSVTLVGALKDYVLTLERLDPEKKETQRFVISLLHDNRFLYHFEVKPEGWPTFNRQYLVGATKEGVPFAATAGGGPECVVSGGAATTPVQYKGKTYYVCCSGCRDAFKDDPEKFIKEYEERLAKEAKERADKYKKP